MKRDLILKVVDLNQRDIYISPLGRRCVLRPGKAHRSANCFNFLYLDIPGSFTLTSENVPLLRKGS